MKKLVCVAAISTVVAAFASGQAQAATFTETDDAGETLETAQTIQGALPLESISGVLSEETPDADLFKILLTGGQTFSATTISPDTLIDLPVSEQLGASTELLEDPQLFLFDSDGRGIYGNDDGFGTIQSTLASGPGGFSPIKSGIYFLGISSFGYDPVSSKGKIFSDQNSDGVLEPMGPGGELFLNGFTGSSTASWRYTITMTGAKAVPEPSFVLGILALGTCWGLGSLQQYQKNKRRSTRKSAD